MSDIVINTCFDGSEISLLMIQQALALYYKKNIAVKLKHYDINKPNYKMLDYCKKHKDLYSLMDTNLMDNAINIYGIDLDIHDDVYINPQTYNIAYTISLKNTSKFYEKLSKFDFILVPDITLADTAEIMGLKNVKVISPDIIVYPNDNLNYDTFDILCNLHSSSQEKFHIFFEAYVQIPKFRDAILTIISDIFANNPTKYDYFIEIIKNIKNKYNIEKNTYRVELLLNQTPTNVNNCIIKSDLLIFPFAHNDRWSLIAANAAAISKQIILTPQSIMPKYIYNCDIIQDLPVFLGSEKLGQQSINIWKIFLSEIELNKKSILIESKNEKFSDFCNKLEMIER